MKTVYIADDGKQYASIKEAKEADAKIAEKANKDKIAKAEREAAANKVTEAYKAAAKAKADATKEMQKFIDKYGSFHQTFTGDDAKAFLEDPIDLLFRFF